MNYTAAIDHAIREERRAAASRDEDARAAPPPCNPIQPTSTVIECAWDAAHELFSPVVTR